MLKTITSTIHIKELSKSSLTELQEALLQLKYNVGKTGADGIYGANTLAAFNEFKEDYELTHPSLIGTTTVKYLQLALEGKIDRQEEDNEPHKDQPVQSKANKVPSKINWLDFNCPVSEYFTVGEVSKFSSNRIVYNEQHRKNVVALCQLLDEVRKAWAKPIGVTSFYRPPAVNKAVRGARNSQHLTGSGVDIYPIGEDARALESWLDHRWGDRALGYGARSGKGFTHLDLRNSPRRIRWRY